MKKLLFSLGVLVAMLTFAFVLMGCETDPPDDNFIAVTNITGVPTQATAGVDLTLTGTVVPSNATNKTIVWSIATTNALTGATVENGVLKTTTAGTATVTATIVNGKTASTNYTQDFTITVTATSSAFVAVTNITGIPSYKQTSTDLTLTGTVEPSDATNKTIVWSINSAGTTGATVTGNVLKTTATGTVVVTATIAKGATETTAYTQNFSINVVDEIPAFIAVTNITGVPTAATAGVDLTLTGTVVPSDATSKTIAWSIATTNALTGATITNGVFKATTAGTATVTATIVNGATATTNYTQNFTINVTAPLSPGEQSIPVNFTAIADETINLGNVNELSTGGNITVTVTGSYTSYEWYIDGEKTTGTTNQIVITGSSLKSGPHTVTAIVLKSATPYSKVLNFTK